MFDLGKAGELYRTLRFSPSAANRVENFSVTRPASFTRDDDKGIEPIHAVGGIGKSVFVRREVRGAIAWQGVLRRGLCARQKGKAVFTATIGNIVVEEKPNTKIFLQRQLAFRHEAIKKKKQKNREPIFSPIPH